MNHPIFEPPNQDALLADLDNAGHQIAVGFLHLRKGTLEISQVDELCRNLYGAQRHVARLAEILRARAGQ